MKLIYLIPILFLLNCNVNSSGGDELKRSEIMEVIYFENENTTYIKFADMIYKGEKYAYVYEADLFIDRFEVAQDVSGNAVKFIGDFTHSIEEGMLVEFKN